MTFKILMAAVAAFAALAAPAAAQEQQPPALPETPRAWRAAAAADLEALRMYIREDTPIAIDTENPRMQAWFEEGYQEARRRVRRVRDQGSYYYALLGYTNAFYDPHLSLSARMQLAPASWPGFITTGRGDDVIVLFRDSDDRRLPAIGARVISCDGRSLAEFRERNIYPFSLNPGLAGDRRRSSPRIFMDRHNPFGPAPRRCVFEENGERRSIRLQWRDVPEGNAYWDQYTIAALGPGASFGVSTPAEGVTWIGVPSFDNGSGEQLRALVDEVTANAATIRAGRAIVIDVRGNGGGSSEWAAEISRAVWGQQTLEANAETGPSSATDWRASPRNLEEINAFLPTLVTQFGEYSQIVLWGRAVQEGVSGAIARNEPIWRQRDEPGDTPVPQGGGFTERRPQGPSPMPARVYVLSNGTCGSACLDFADIALHIPGTQLIGEATSGDGLLMEIRVQVLPSGLAQVGLPMKVYRGRSRGALEAYQPDVAYDGIWTDEAVRAWTLELIARQ